MGFRFRRSVWLLPGVRLNFSKSGTSLSVGRRGATENFSKRGTKTTAGLPGTGLSWSQMAKAPPTPGAINWPIGLLRLAIIALAIIAGVLILSGMAGR